jgi:hypothetical protein
MHQALSSSEDEVPQRKAKQSTSSLLDRGTSESSPKKQSTARTTAAKEAGKQKTKIKVEKEADIKKRNTSSTAQDNAIQRKLLKPRTTLNSSGMIPGRNIVSEEVREEISQLIQTSSSPSEIINDLVSRLELAFLAGTMDHTRSDNVFVPALNTDISTLELFQQSSSELIEGKNKTSEETKVKVESTESADEDMFNDDPASFWGNVRDVVCVKISFC